MSGRLPWQDPPQLLNQKLAAIDFRRYDPALIRSALQAALLDGLQLTEVSILSSKLEALLQDISAAGDTLECSWDSTVRTSEFGEATALEKAGADSKSSRI